MQEEGPDADYSEASPWAATATQAIASARAKRRGQDTAVGGAALE